MDEQMMKAGVRRKQVTIFFRDDPPGARGTVYKDVGGVAHIGGWLEILWLDGTRQGFCGDSVRSYYLSSGEHASSSGGEIYAGDRPEHAGGGGATR